MAVVETYPQVSATEAGAHFGRTLDQAARGPVTIRRRGEQYVLIRGDQYERQLAETASQAYLRLSLEQLLAGYDKAEHRSDWPDDGPVGKESL